MDKDLILAPLTFLSVYGILYGKGFEVDDDIHIPRQAPPGGSHQALFGAALLLLFTGDDVHEVASRMK